MTRHSILDRFYDGCGVLAAIALMMIAVIILVQAAARWIGVSAQGLGEWAGYMMAASSFLAFAHTFRKGGHIRVMLMMEKLRGEKRRKAEIVAHVIGTALSGFLAFYAVRFVWVSYIYGEMSEGSDAMPLWIPRLAMALGSIALFVAVLHTLVEILQNRVSFEPAPDGEFARTE